MAVGRRPDVGLWTLSIVALEVLAFSVRLMILAGMDVDRVAQGMHRTKAHHVFRKAHNSEAKHEFFVSRLSGIR